MAKPNGPTDLVGGFKVKIKDSNGSSQKYIKHDLSLDSGSGDCFDGYLHYGTTYVYVNASGNLDTTTAATYWTLVNNRLTYSANDTTYYLIQNATGTAVAVQTSEPSSGYTIKTEDC